MGKKIINAALVGCGTIGAFTRSDLRDRLGPNWLPLSHAEALHSCEGVRLAACCDPDETAAARAAATFNIPAQYRTHEALFEAEDIDLLAVATRSDIRPAILKAAVRSGVKGIHSEKPLALSLGDTQSAVDVLKRSGVCFSYGALRRYMPVFHRAKAAIDEGEIGELQALTVRFGKGGHLWTHPHSVDLMCYLAGDPPVAYVQANMLLDDDRVDDKLIDCDPVVLSATILFENDVVGQIVPEGGLSIDIAGRSAGLSVLGDGAYLLRRSYGLSLECQADRMWKFEVDDSRISGRLRAIEDVRDAIIKNRPTLITLDHVAEQHRILFAMVQSHLQGGRRVALDEVDSALTVTGRYKGLTA